MAQMKNKVMSLVNSGKYLEAKRECLEICKKQPGNAEIWFILSAICGHMQDFKSAERYCRKALKLNPAVPAAYYNLAVAQRRQGKNLDAQVSLKKAVELQRDFSAALFELGNICLENSEYKHAVKYYQDTISSNPDAYQAYAGMAAAQQQSGDSRSAISAYKESLRINSNQQDVAIKLAHIYENEGSVEDAIHYYNYAIKIGHQKEDVYINIGSLYALQLNYYEAEQCYKKALMIYPESIEALTNLALLYNEMRDPINAYECIEKAHQIGSEDERFIYNRAKILASVCRYTEAEKLYEIILDENPKFCEAAVNLGNIYLLSGRVDDAYKMYAYACEIKPDYHDACSNMLMSLNYTNACTNTEIHDKHLSWASRVESNVGKVKTQSPGPPDSRSVIRVGYVSPDFRSHSVAYFIEAILKNSDEKKVVNYCYSDVHNKDLVTQRLQKYADHWRDVRLLNNELLANLVQKDKIDVLVDLCGHMSGNRLSMFALKPAPVQVTYLGYPNTTGLSSMDYRIVDKFTDPVGSENMMSETPLYLNPSFLAYTPYEDSPKVTDLPALRNGFVTFGSFNNLAKITDEVVNVWSRILLRVPYSRLCIKARQFADEVVKSNYFKRFGDNGVEVDRLEFIPYEATIKEHLYTYNKIDIALDTFPYNGTTTTFEALWMGVPVICNTGDRHSSRVGVSILTNAALDEFLSSDNEEYIEIASILAADLDKLEKVRIGLRRTMEVSVLLNTKSFAGSYESLVTDLFN